MWKRKPRRIASPIQRRREIAEPHAEHQRPREIDARPAAVDAALDAPGGALAAGEKRGRALPAIGHRRRKKPRAHHRHADPVARQARAQRLGIGAQPRLAGAISRAVGQAAIGRDRGDRDDPAAAARAHRRHQRRDRVDRADQVDVDLPQGRRGRLARAVRVGAGRGAGIGDQQFDRMGAVEFRRARLPAPAASVTSMRGAVDASRRRRGTPPRSRRAARGCGRPARARSAARHRQRQRRAEPARRAGDHDRPDTAPASGARPLANAARRGRPGGPGSIARNSPSRRASSALQPARPHERPGPPQFRVVEALDDDFRAARQPGQRIEIARDRGSARRPPARRG